MSAITPIKQLLTHHFCPRKLYLEEIYNLKRPKTEREVKEHILQEALRYTNRAEAGVIKSIPHGTSSPHRIRERYYSSNQRALQEALLNNKELLSKAGMSIIETSKELRITLNKETKARIDNVNETIQTKEKWGNELWWDIEPKITYAAHLVSTKRALSTIIDRIDNYKTEAQPYLFKKSKAPEEGIWPSDRTELAAAMILCADEGLTIQEGHVAYEEGKHPRRLPMSPELETQLMSRLSTVRTTLSQKTLPARVTNKNKCDNCPLKDQCYDDILMTAKGEEHRL